MVRFFKRLFRRKTKGISDVTLGWGFHEFDMDMWLEVDPETLQTTRHIAMTGIVSDLQPGPSDPYLTFHLPRPRE